MNSQVGPLRFFSRSCFSERSWYTDTSARDEVNRKIFMKYFLFSLLFFVAIIISTSAESVQAVTCPAPPANWTVVGGVCVPTTAGTGLSSNSVSAVIATVLLWLLGIVSIIGILAFVISGVQYLTAVGDDDQISTAKRNMKYAIIGVIVALSGLIIITQIDQLFKGNANF